jgi:hypothetical protein
LLVLVLFSFWVRTSWVGAANCSQAVGFLECKFLCIYLFVGRNELVTVLIVLPRFSGDLNPEAVPIPAALVLRRQICSEVLILLGMSKYNRRIHENLYLFVKIKDFMGAIGVS